MSLVPIKHTEVTAIWTVEDIIVGLERRILFIVYPLQRRSRLITANRAHIDISGARERTQTCKETSNQEQGSTVRRFMLDVEMPMPDDLQGVQEWYFPNTRAL